MLIDGISVRHRRQGLALTECEAMLAWLRFGVVSQCVLHTGFQATRRRKPFLLITDVVSTMTACIHAHKCLW